MTGFSDPYRLRVAGVRAGVYLSYAVCAALAAYSVATWDEPHRGAILVLAGGAVVATVVVHLIPVGKIVDSGYSDAFFLTWSFTDLAFITALCVADGGVVTPLTSLFFLPLVFAGLFYPLRLALVVVTLTLVLYLLTGVVAGFPDGTRLILFMSVLAMTGALCVWAAREQERRQDELERLSRTDPLTGSLNRRGFDERFQAELATAARDETELALILLDLDGFKAVNDTFGHSAGDDLLVWVVEQFDSVSRPADTIGRIGGDEFAVVLPRTSCDEAEQIAARMSQTAKERIPVTTGVACFPDEGLDQDALMRVADAALYGAKAARTAS